MHICDFKLCDAILPFFRISITTLFTSAKSSACFRIRSLFVLFHDNILALVFTIYNWSKYDLSAHLSPCHTSAAFCVSCPSLFTPPSSPFPLPPSPLPPRPALQTLSHWSANSISQPMRGHHRVGFSRFPVLLLIISGCHSMYIGNWLKVYVFKQKCCHHHYVGIPTHWWSYWISHERY